MSDKEPGMIFLLKEGLKNLRILKNHRVGRIQNSFMAVHEGDSTSMQNRFPTKKSTSLEYPDLEFPLEPPLESKKSFIFRMK